MLINSLLPVSAEWSMFSLYHNCRMVQMKWVDGKSQKFMLDIQFRLPTEMLLCDTYSRTRQYHYTNEYYLAVQFHWPFNSCMRMTPHVMRWSDRSGYYTPLVWQWCVCAVLLLSRTCWRELHTLKNRNRCLCPHLTKKH